MSLVDYASSDEEEELHEQPQENKQLSKAEEPTPRPLLDPLPTRNDNRHLPQPQNQRTSSSLNKEALHSSSLSESSELKLPDASLLLNSPTMPGNLGHNTDHSSLVAAAMAENATRKRDIKEVVFCSHLNLLEGAILLQKTSASYFGRRPRLSCIHSDRGLC
ncbi:hypothetical protein AABB24_021855 [Solanum stoloniferum]|uniref:Uncharacterized protein n=1 Tax=Solanum stoloniferum TaxID=62892 RepID=A0ABD2SWX1_9SOLN